ncbi:hypothetical protein AIOL_004703 [Candidatus Rhodobacter oscarellae]|uniref:YCII-related domain-containing protein n=1 Tax=Candidatus Rhodobacter oscarellae TaxID=1675527 RepID=A0A0J9EAB1_9RHOB|nr:YciI family protein [Candidatus Rhodobacter lobularis]KMW59720.1 hypothetical protein AIOL_004703 [Candidatus Rhodobacter lobularis]
MPRYMFVYHGGKAPESPEEGEKAMAAWGAWYGAMGDAVADGGGPAGPSMTVSPSGVAEDGGANPVSGLTIVEAADQAAACEMAKGCPMIEEGSGSVEVAEIIQM